MYPRLRQQPATALGDFKNLSKMIEKSSKNLPKIYQNPSKNNYKIIRIGSWAPRPPEPLRAQNRSNFPLPPGSVLEGFWSHVGFQEPLKGHSKKHTKFDCFGSPSFIDFAWILEAFWEGFGSHVGFQDAL